MKTKNILLILSAIATTSFFCGCSTQTKYIETGGSQALITESINIADWNNAASSLTNDLLSSGAIEDTGEKQPIKLLVSRVVNRTSEIIDTDLLTKQVVMVLNNSKKVRVVNSDAATQQLLAKEVEKTGIKAEDPKITITGKIMEVRAKNSSASEVTYVFTLEVNHLGTSIWMGQKQLSKQTTKSTFGF